VIKQESTATDPDTKTDRGTSQDCELRGRLPVDVLPLFAKQGRGFRGPPSSTDQRHNSKIVSPGMGTGTAAKLQSSDPHQDDAHAFETGAYSPAPEAAP